MRGDERSSAYTALVHDDPDTRPSIAGTPPIQPPPLPRVDTGAAQRLQTVGATLDAVAGSDAVQPDQRGSGGRSALRADGEAVARSVDAGTAEGAEEARPEGRAGPGRGARRSRREGRASNDETNEGHQPFRAEPTPLPHTGNPGLPPSRLRIAVRAPPYKSPGDLPPPAPQRGAEDAKPSGPDPRTAKSVYAEAVNVAKSYYGELVGVAVEIADAAEREARRAHEQLEANLVLSLQRLGDSLSARLAANDQSRETALTHLESLATNLRRRIRLAARSAHGRLSAMRGKYESETADSRGKRVTLPSRVQDTLSDNFFAMWDADQAIDNMVANPGDYFSESDFAGDNHGAWMAKTMREAMIEFVGPYATADKEALDTRHDTIDESLSPMADCLPCQLDTAFQALDARMDYFMVVGPRSISNAQNGAIARVDDLVGQMRISIEEAHASTARSMVEQHDSTRDTLIQMARMEQSGIATQTEAGTGQLVGLLTAIAGSQTRGLDATHAELSKAADQPPAIYATSVISGSARLKSNILGQTKAYPAPQQAKARQAASLRGVQRRAAERQRETALNDFDRALADSIRRTYSQLDSSTEREFQRMANVPGQVRSTCDQALSQAEEARATDVANLRRAVDDLEARVNAAIAGQPPPQPTRTDGHGTPTPTPAPTPAPGATPNPAAGTAQGAGAGTPAPGAGQPMPPPASCANCQQEAGGDTATPNPGGRPGEQGGHGGGTQTGGGARTDAPGATGGTSANSYLSSTSFQTYANAIANDPAQAEGVLAFKARIIQSVQTEIQNRASQCHSALDHWRQPDTPQLMRALRGLTYTSGRAVQEAYTYGNLRNDIWQKYTDAVHRTFASTDTIQFNYNAAINLLDGNPSGGALEELRASINYSNEDSRIIEIMQNLTPAQLAQIPSSELDKIAADLDGEMLERFNALRRGDGGMERAITLRDSINSAYQYYGTQRGRKLQEAVATARNAGGLPIEGDPNRQMADIFHLEHPDAVRARADGLWHSTLENFADLRQVQYTLHYQTADTDPTHMAPQLTEEQRRQQYNQPFQYDRNFAQGRSTEELENLMLRFTVADRYYAGPPSSTATQRAPPGYHGESSGIADRPGRLPPDMVNWISQTIHHGPGSFQERAAHALVEFNRAEERGSAERLDQALHIGSADAVEGGMYTPRNNAAADRERDQVLAQFSTYRRELSGQEPLIGPEDPRAAQRALRERFSTALHDDAPARSMALGIIASEHGSPVAAMEYAIDRGNKDMALRYLRRMDRHEIDAMVTEYDAHHSPGLYEKLGLFQHHSMGAAFSGDDALELEIAIMGVPQNDRERGEVALRRMDQQIEHSTGAGQAVASDEFARLQANRDELRREMGITASDIDEHGRVRLVDAHGNHILLGNFNENGSFRPTPGATLSGFERAVALGQITAENFTRAVDAAAHWITTALAVIAAVVITIATAGAASILLPMLLTAAIGLAGVGITWALKGGRYSRDDLTRDLANVAVQTIVAGVGAAAGLYMRAGAMGGRAVGTMMGRLSMAEGKLAAHLGMEELAKLTLRQELMLGALNGVLGNVGGAMADPVAWREGRVGEEIWHGMIRGAVSGMIASATMRPLSGLGQDASLATRIGARALLSGVSNSATKAWDLAYDAHRGAYAGSLGDALDEIGTAGATGVVQGGLEAGGEHFGQHSGIAERLQNNRIDPERAQRAAPAGQTRPTTETSPASELPDTAKRPPPPGTGLDENGAIVPHAVVKEDRAGPTRPSEVEERGGTRRLPEPANDNAEQAEPVARLRSARGEEEAPARLRSGGGFDDEVTKPGVPIPHPEFPQGVDLKAGDLDHLPVILPDTVVRGTDPKDGAQAQRNYDIMRGRQPNVEVLLAYNPASGEYMAVQGLPNSVTPPPEGWITLRHSHPRVIGADRFSLFASILPSGIGGDFSVLRTEVERLAARSPDTPHAAFSRASTIDIEVDGAHVQTVFQITKQGDNYSLTVTLNPPQHGVEALGPFRGNRDTALREYAYTARDLTAAGSDFGLGHNKTSGPDLLTAKSGPDAPSRVIRGATLDETERMDAMFVARRMAAAENFEQQARGIVPRGEIDPVLGHAATRSDAQERVRAMGLVGQSDSLERLTRLLNSSDTGFTPEMRAAVARVTLEATRADLIRSGNLAPGDELLMLFRGVTGARTGDYEREGMDLGHVKDWSDEDAGRGLYGSQDFQSALRYTGEDGQGAVLPLIVRRSELGNVIDVRSGTPLGDRWLAYVRATAKGGIVKETHPHLARVLYPFSDSPIGVYRDGRGDRFENFLKMLADDPTLPAPVREAARDPHITLMDLGGVASWGNDRSMLTDQFAMHHQRILDMFNEAHGFPVPGFKASPEEGPVRLRSALGGDDEPVTSTSVVPGGETSGKGAPVAPAAPEGPMVPGGSEPQAPTLHPEHEAAESALVRSVVRRSEDVPEFIGILGRLMDVNEALFGRLLLATSPEERLTAMRGIAEELRRRGTQSAEQIDHTLRELGSLLGRVQERFQVEMAHSRLLAAHAAEVALLPPFMRAIVEESPLALHLMTNPQLTNGEGESLFDFYSARAAKRKPPPSDAAEFDQFVMNSIRRTRKDTVLAGHAPALEAFMTSLGDFNAGLEVGAPLARQTVGDELDLQPAARQPLPKEVIDGLEPVPLGAQLEPGTRVEVPPYGFGTFMSDQDGLMWIHLDVDSAHGELTGVPQDLAPVFLAPGEQTGPGGARVPVRSQTEQDEFQKRIDAVRTGHADKGVPAFDPQTPSGTVAIAHVADQDFLGTNSTLAAALTTMSVSERNALLEIMRQFGIDPEHPGQRHDFVDHAELASLVAARQEIGPGMMPPVVEIFVDRAACPNCRANLHALASWLGVSEIRIYYRNQKTPPPPLIIKAR